MVAVATGDIGEAELARWFREHSTPRKPGKPTRP
jgi:hypothetical protein